VKGETRSVKRRRDSEKADNRGIKTPVLEKIKESIPTIVSLRPCFWADTNFLYWQILRLNKNYQKAAEGVWKIHPLGQTVNQLLYLSFFFEDFPPEQKESIHVWEDRLEPQSSRADWDLRSLIKISSLSQNTYPPPSPPSIFRYFSKSLGLGFQPIPHHVRFPLPILLSNLSDSPLKDFFEKKGRPPKWARNLLIYELSQAGMKDMEIARLLFGVKKSTENWPDKPKHPILAKIYKTKRTMEKIISESYPFESVTKNH